MQFPKKKKKFDVNAKSLASFMKQKINLHKLHNNLRNTC